MGLTGVDALRQYVDELPLFLVNRFIAKDQLSAVVFGLVPDQSLTKLVPIVDQIERRLNAVRKADPVYGIAVTGLSVIAARNSADMIGKLNRALTIEFAFIAAFIGFAFRSARIGLACLPSGIFPVVAGGAGDARGAGCRSPDPAAGRDLPSAARPAQAPTGTMTRRAAVKAGLGTALSALGLSASRADVPSHQGKEGNVPMSHHLDTPLAAQNGQLYIDDLYVFSGADGTVFIMDVNSNITGVHVKPGFHHEARYEFKVHFDGASFETLTYRVSFAEAGPDGRQAMKLHALTG